MTVKELIELLQTFEETDIVIVDEPGRYGPIQAEDVRRNEIGLVIICAY